MDRIRKIMQREAEVIEYAYNNLPEEDVKKALDLVVEKIRNDNGIFIVGMGRTGLIGECFAVRLVQMGARCYVVGHSTERAIRSDDLLIALSVSGNTAFVNYAANVAKDEGADVLAVTMNADSKIAEKADVVVVLPEPEEIILRTFSEMLMLSFLDGFAAQLAEELGVDESDMWERHAKIQ
ncbi:SIS domain-containing protein [Methanopyrus sp. KOL6]|uniref:SIS domain-containing protein n=1 Tax=Methanopyrus sp. KOL6 TaxID=1937004 RepID=UPI000B4ACB33|nr:SIS domain-containing protein [Methanopyrus sp. KOL6]